MPEKKKQKKLEQKEDILEFINECGRWIITGYGGNIGSYFQGIEFKLTRQQQ